MATDQLTDIQALRQLITDVGGSVSLHAGHLADSDHPCQCRYIFDEAHLGGIAEIYVNNGIPSAADGGNDAPVEPLAIAYLKLLVGAANALPGLLDELETLRGR